MRQYLRVAAIVMLLAAGSAVALAGAGNRAGTNGASELLIPVGARYIGMGSVGIATSKGVEALYWNPAGSARMDHSASLFFSQMSYLADIGVSYGAVSVAFQDFGVMSLSLKSLAIGDIDVTTTDHPDGTGQQFRPQYFTVGLSFARQLSERVGVGLTANLISERLGEVSASGVAFNVGVIYDNLAAVDGLSAGIVVKNIGPSMRFGGSGLLVQASVANQNRPAQFYELTAASFELPTSIEFGLGYKKSIAGAHSVLVSGTFLSNNFSDDEYRVGAEYSYQDLLYLRGGWDLAQQVQDQREYLFGPSFGVGVHTSLGSIDVSFDYAYRGMKVFDANQVFSIVLGF
jgi:hypothetical protein